MELPLTPLELARRARKLYGHREAVVDGDLRLTYEQFFHRCDRWSAVLQSFGIRQGDRVAVISRNTHAMLESFYAVPQIGAVVVPINFRLNADDFAYLIKHSGARMVCAHSDYLGAIDAVRGQLTNVDQFIALEGSRDGWINYEAMIATMTADYQRPTIAENDLISINYTSGTTSKPKGVMVTHRNAWINMMGTLAHVPMDQSERYLWTLPMFHANGWTFAWIVTAVGGAHVCLRSVEARSVCLEIMRERITMLCAAPTVLINIASGAGEQRADLPPGVRVLTAGAPPAAATIERVESEFGWRIIHVYGLTETGPFLTICEERPEDGTLTTGERARIKARQGVDFITAGELRVVDKEGNDVPKDGTALGEVVVRGNAIMKGYYNDSHATETAFADGWFHSGDAAVVHADGYIEIRDRYKDVIISGGENISSIEVEGVLMLHSAILEAAVIGVPNEKWGEVPHAFIVLREGEAATRLELREFCRSHLAHFKVPQEFQFVSELPRTATGKIQKFVLRKGRNAINPH